MFETGLVRANESRGQVVKFELMSQVVKFELMAGPRSAIGRAPDS